jgi:alkanesulfonate monooxygenase SsuD/methylene tetrahydromethanopterin reductase-like flavin-dependent oxidoreductase (luciferase family)
MIDYEAPEDATPMPATTPIHLAVALDGAGWHPAAWRQAEIGPGALFTPGYWVEIVRRAEQGLLDFVTIEDSLAMQSAHPFVPDDRTDQVRGRLDAVLVAARVAPATHHIGLVPSVTVTHTEPFHISKAIATLDFVSSGRAGVRVQVSGRAHEAALFGRRQFPERLYRQGDRPDGHALTSALFEEAGDYVEVVRRLWDSWEDDAEIRDVSTGRFVNRGKLHYIDFEGRFFSVKGPSITPRPPQGQPLVTALAHSELPYRFGAAHADLVYVTPHDFEQVRSIVREVHEHAAAAGRPAGAVHVLADLVVFLDASSAAASDRKARLDEADGREYRSDADVFVGTPLELAELLAAWSEAGLSGYRLRPAVLSHDLDAIADGVVPELQARGLFRRSYEGGSLRERFGLPRPANRFAAV